MKGFEQIPLENESSEVAPKKPASGKLKKLGKWLAGAAIVTGGATGLEHRAYADDSKEKAPLEEVLKERAELQKKLASLHSNVKLSYASPEDLKDPAKVKAEARVLASDFIAFLLDEKYREKVRSFIDKNLSEVESDQNFKDISSLYILLNEDKEPITTRDLSEKKYAPIKQQAIEQELGRLESLQKFVKISERLLVDEDAKTKVKTYKISRFTLSFAQWLSEKSPDIYKQFASGVSEGKIFLSLHAKQYALASGEEARESRTITAAEAEKWQKEHSSK